MTSTSSVGVTRTFVPLVPGETILTDDAELLHRQFPPHLYDPQTGLPTAFSFGPLPADDGKPSFVRSSVMSAKEAGEWFNGRENLDPKKPSRFAMSCSVEEVHSAGTTNLTQMRAVDDSETPLAPGSERPDGHTYIDYRELDRPTIKLVRLSIFAAAKKRGMFPV